MNERIQSNNFRWIENWFYQKFEKKSLKEGFIKIFTIDNPGWGLLVDLRNFGESGIKFNEIKVDRTDNDWFICYERDGVFESAGGLLNFLEILDCFRNWIEQHNIDNIYVQSIKFKTNFIHDDSCFLFLMDWFYKHCDGDWEHCFGVGISTTEKGWTINISLSETELENRSFKKLMIQREKQDWLECSVEKGAFIGNGGPLNLIEILEIFQNWAQG